jgi:hypothetical protein
MSNPSNIPTIPQVDHVEEDPIFAALQSEQRAFQAFSDALTELARAGAFSLDLQSEEFIAFQRERLPELEATEAKASAALIEAERALLTTRPTTIEGAAALLGFLRKHLSEDPDIEPVIHAISNIEAVFGGPAQTTPEPALYARAAETAMQRW